MRGASKKVMSVLVLSTTLGIAAAALAGPGRTQAPGQEGPPMPPAPPQPAFCYNVDVTNASSAAANDLHFTLSGPDHFYSFYDGGHFGLPSSYAHNSNGTWSVDYQLPPGSYVPRGAITHVGWCSDKGVAGMVVRDSGALPPFYWTLDGKQIGRIPPLGHEWDSVVLQSHRFVEIGLTNPSPTPIRILQFDWAVVDQPFHLNELMWDSLADAVAWQPLQVDGLVPAGTADGAAKRTALVPLPVTADETRHLVFRVLATDPAQPENIIRGIGQTQIAAAVQPRGDGK